MRPKRFWVGYHYGTVLDDGQIAHTMPGVGKRVTSLQEFADGKGVTAKRGTRTPLENAAVQQRALSNLGAPYKATASNCEHDASYVHDGVAWSPMLRSVLLGLGIGAVLGILVNSSNRFTPRQRRSGTTP